MHRLLDEARAGRVLVAVDQAHQLGLGGVGAVGIDVKADLLSRLDRDPIDVTEQLDLRHRCSCGGIKVPAAARS
jgi:hypothetical protein